MCASPPYARVLVSVALASAILLGPTTALAQDEDPGPLTAEQSEEAKEIFDTRSLVELTAIHEAGPGDPEYDLVAAEYGEDYSEWEELWHAHNPRSDDVARAVALFETKDLEQVRVIYSLGPGSDNYDLIASEYGDNWDEWVELWAAHNPDVDLEAEAAAANIDIGGDDGSSAWLIAALVIGLAVVAGVVAAIVIKTRGSEPEPSASNSELVKPGFSGRG
jgi:hypothetical protein